MVPVSATSATFGLGTTPLLVGAAVALGAETLGPLTHAERSLVRMATSVPDAEVGALAGDIRSGRDPLGEAFCALRSAAERRLSGAVYTPPSIVHAMLSWAISKPHPARVVDPGSGSARFAAAAARAMPDAEIVAVEIDPLAALLSRAMLATLGVQQRSHVVVGDYRAYVPETIEGSTLYIGNPPYVRHHAIDPEWKQWFATAAASRGLRASKLAGLHVHFFLATVAHARPGDRGAFITSSEWLDVNYGALLRDLLMDGLGGTALHLLSPEALPFAGTATTGVITCFEIGSRPSTMRFRRVRSASDLGALTGGRPVGRARLEHASRWTGLMRAKVPPIEGLVALGDLCRVHRGAVTGCNRVWVADRAKIDLPDAVLVPAVTRARDLFKAGDSIRSLDGLRVVIDLPADLDELDPAQRSAVRRFLDAVERSGVREGYIARHRRVWWKVGLREPAPILTTYMARRAPAIVRNPAGARHINIAHGLYPREPMTAAELDRLARSLRTAAQVGEGRTYAGGLTKFEPSEMEALLVPDPRQPPA